MTQGDLSSSSPENRAIVFTPSIRGDESFASSLAAFLRVHADQGICTGFWLRKLFRTPRPDLACSSSADNV